MAENKKSFILYCDINVTVKKLTDQQAGKLFKTILGYVNDENPIVDNIVIDLAFEPIKQQLKRDLRKYEAICDRNKHNGEKGGRPHKETQNKPKKPSGLITVINSEKNNPKKPDTDTDIDIDIDIEKKKKLGKKPTTERQIDFYNSLIPFLAEHPKERIKAFYNYWSEITQDGKKMKYELEKTWQTSNRLATWASREKPNFKSETKSDEKIYQPLTS